MSTSIEVPGLHHGGAPIPQAAIVRGLLMSSAVNGMDPEDGTVPAALEEQVALVFANVRRILAAAGATVDDVVKLTFFVRDRAASRGAIDAEWIAMFPDAARRPARHILNYALAGSLHLQAEITAVVATEASA
jgi:enamine deaminase RidA (YjgF/YER057c/UK114 family)